MERSKENGKVGYHVTSWSIQDHTIKQMRYLVVQRSMSLKMAFIVKVEKPLGKSSGARF